MGVREVLAACGLFIFLVGACTGPSESASPQSGNATPTSMPRTSNSSVQPSQTTSSQAPNSPTTTSYSTATSDDKRPKQAQKHDSAGADAFVRFYLRRVNEAWRAPNPAFLAGLATTACGSCVNFEKTAARLSTSKQRYDANAVDLGVSAELPESTSDRISIQGVIVQLPAQVLDQRGHVVRKAKRTATLGNLTAVWTGARWQMQEITFEADAQR